MDLKWLIDPGLDQYTTKFIANNVVTVSGMLYLLKILTEVITPNWDGDNKIVNALRNLFPRKIFTKKEDKDTH